MAIFDKINANGNVRDFRDAAAVRFNESQSLTDAQKQTARGNIGAVAIKQDVAQAGKVLVVGQDGNVTTGDAALSDALKAALIQLAEKIVYVDANGQQYYNALYEALYNTPAPTPGDYDYKFNIGEEIILGQIGYEYKQETGAYYVPLEYRIIPDTPYRVVYPTFDFAYEADIRYVVRVKATFAPKIAFNPTSAAGMQKVAAHQDITNYSVSSGWQDTALDGSEYQYVYTPPAAINGSPTAYIRFSLKKTDDSIIMQDELRYVTIKKEPLYNKYYIGHEIILGQLSTVYVSASDGYYTLLPYSPVDPSTPYRVIYPTFDLAYEAGCRYVFRVKATFAPKFALNVINAAGMEEVNRKAAEITAANVLVAGWYDMTLDGDEYQYSYTPPTTINNSPTAFIRFNFRKSDNSIILQNELEYVTVRKEAL